MMKAQLLTFFFILSLPFGTLATSSLKDSSLRAHSDSVVQLYDRITQAKDDKTRSELAQELHEEVDELLNCKGIFQAKFPDLSDRMAILYAPDKEFRLFNWNVAYRDGTHEFHAYILESRDNGNVEVTELKAFEKDQGRDGKRGSGLWKRELEKMELKPGTWIPALYYRIIRKERNGKAFYVMLGWDGKNVYTTRKQIEVLHFTEKGKIQFGKPIFKGGPEVNDDKEDYGPEKKPGHRSILKERRKRRQERRPEQRIIFEYTNDGMMTLNYEKEKDRIVFNDLVPKNPNLEGMYEFYEPDLIFNAYVWQEEGYWKFKEKVEPENEGGGAHPWNDPEE